MKINKLQKSSLWKSLLAQGLNLIYPQFCLECNTPLEIEEKYCCSTCYSFLELIPIGERCTCCFNLREKCALSCPFRSGKLLHVAAALEYTSTAQTFIQVMKYRNRPYLTQGLAGFMYLQWLKLGWTLPDFLVPVPIHWIKKSSRGYNQSQLLAQSLSALMGVPVCSLLKKTEQTVSQARLNQKMRRELSENVFIYHGKEEVVSKKILLVDDVMTTQTTLRRCADVLWEEHPQSIEALTCCFVS